LLILTFLNRGLTSLKYKYFVDNEISLITIFFFVKNSKLMLVLSIFSGISVFK